LASRAWAQQGRAAEVLSHRLNARAAVLEAGATGPVEGLEAGHGPWGAAGVGFYSRAVLCARFHDIALLDRLGIGSRVG